jgi:hypothetical protein
MQTDINRLSKEWGNVDGQVILAYGGAAGASIVFGTLFGILWTSVTSRNVDLIRKTVYLYIGLLILVIIIGTLTDLWAGSFLATIRTMMYSWGVLILAAEVLNIWPPSLLLFANALLSRVVGSGFVVMTISLLVLWNHGRRGPPQATGGELPGREIYPDE